MAKQTKISVNLDGLEKIRKGLGSGMIARVGILGDSSDRQDGDGMSNSEIAVIHEFGSEENNIPPRSFLRMPVETKKRELVKSLATPAFQKLIEAGDFRGVFKLIGIKAEQIIQESFQTRGFGFWPPNAPATIRAKGSDAPLIDTGQLRRAITSDVKDKNASEKD